MTPPFTFPALSLAMVACVSVFASVCIPFPSHAQTLTLRNSNGKSRTISPSSTLPGSGVRSGASAARPPGLDVTGLPRVNVPTLPRTAYTKYQWNLDIVATVFWVGELPSGNNTTPNHASSWDPEWAKNFGGFDDPDPLRRGRDFCPLAFKPGMNPFYIALPYNDVLNYKTTKPEASRYIPWFKERFVKAGKSVLKGQWVAIRCGNAVCYAQWQDCGPWVTDDAEYVFKNARPKNMENGGAGIDISPAVRDFLGLSSGMRCDWRFVDMNEIPDGPWRNFGSDNQFVQSKARAVQQQNDMIASRIEELRRMREEYFKKNGSGVVR